LGERVAVAPAGFLGLVGVARTAAAACVLEFLPFAPAPTAGRPPALDVDRFLEFPEFLERDLELAIAGDLQCVHWRFSRELAGGPRAAGRNYLARVLSSVWMVAVHALAG
jgi:hypothetical protein